MAPVISQWSRVTRHHAHIGATCPHALQQLEEQLASEAGRTTSSASSRRRSTCVPPLAVVEKARRWARCRRCAATSRRASAARRRRGGARRYYEPRAERLRVARRRDAEGRSHPLATAGARRADFVAAPRRHQLGAQGARDLAGRPPPRPPRPPRGAHARPPARPPARPLSRAAPRRPQPDTATYLDADARTRKTNVGAARGADVVAARELFFQSKFAEVRARGGLQLRPRRRRVGARGGDCRAYHPTHRTPLVTAALPPQALSGFEAALDDLEAGDALARASADWRGSCLSNMAASGTTWATGRRRPSAAGAGGGGGEAAGASRSSASRKWRRGWRRPRIADKAAAVTEKGATERRIDSFPDAPSGRRRERRRWEDPRQGRARGVLREPRAAAAAAAGRRAPRRRRPADATRPAEAPAPSRRRRQPDGGYEPVRGPIV